MNLDIHEFYKEWLLVKKAIKLLFSPEEWAALHEIGKHFEESQSEINTG